MGNIDSKTSCLPDKSKNQIYSDKIEEVPND